MTAKETPKVFEGAGMANDLSKKGTYARLRVEGEGEKGVKGTLYLPKSLMGKSATVIVTIV